MRWAANEPLRRESSIRTATTCWDSRGINHYQLEVGSMVIWLEAGSQAKAPRACLQTHHGSAPLLDPALSESRVRATLQTRPRCSGSTTARVRVTHRCRV